MPTSFLRAPHPRRKTLPLAAQLSGCEPDPWLCVPASRRVCLCQEGGSAIRQREQRTCQEDDPREPSVRMRPYSSCGVRCSLSHGTSCQEVGRTRRAGRTVQETTETATNCLNARHVKILTLSSQCDFIPRPGRIPAWITSEDIRRIKRTCVPGRNIIIEWRWGREGWSGSPRSACCPRSPNKRYSYRKRMPVTAAATTKTL